MSDRKLKLGVIGIGNQGSNYLKSANKGNLPEIEITCVADIDARKFERAKELLPDVTCFNTATELINSGLCEAVVIATPHYIHPELSIEAMKAGLHVMSEKPAGVYTKQVREAIEFSKTVDTTYAIMFNQRTNPVYRKMRELVRDGGYGELRRFNWIVTGWYRTQAYYNSGGWRATWEGEGGGVMLNQCPHQLDLWQWICGMPSKVKAVCHEGKWHDIEVEDDVSIYVEYPNGATGVFITSTGDYPGTTRLEVTLERAKIVCDFDYEIGKFVIKIAELSDPIQKFTYESTEGFAKPDLKWQTFVMDQSANHEDVVNPFASHILHGTPLIAEGYEGINGLTISNAAFLSAWLDKTIEIPFDEDLFYNLLQEKINNSTFKKTVKEIVQEDMDATYKL